MNNYNELYKLTKNLKVLYVEDDISFQNETSDLFNYFFDNVDLAIDGKEGLHKYLSFYKTHTKYYDIVITDINMPEINGIDLSKKIYSYNEEQAILVVSAHDQRDYLIELINIGVESFLIKPLEYDNMIKAFYETSKKIINNSIKNKSKSVISLGEGFLWNKEKDFLFKDEKNIKLTKKEILIMKLLIENKKAVTTNEIIFDTLWPNEYELHLISSLQPLISRLRKKLPEDILKNVYGLGYRLDI